MIVAVHALLGATLARLCKTHTQAAVLGSASHPLADMLPHRDLDVPEEALLLAATLTLIAASRGVGSREFAGALGAAAPDLENLIGRMFGIPDEQLLLPTHSQYHGRKSRDFSGQVAIALVGLAALFLPAGSCDSQPPTW